MLGVETDKHVGSQTDRAAEDFRGALDRRGIAVKSLAREGLRAFTVELASPQSWNDALTVAGEFQTFERGREDQGAGRFTLTMSEREALRLRDDAVRQGLETIRNRVDQFGVAEPTIQKQGDNRILVQLPGVQDPARAKALVDAIGELPTEVSVIPFADAAGLDVPLVVNATPLGSEGEELPAPALHPGVLVVDLLYRPAVTPLQTAARAAGATAFGGLGLLLHQAALSFELWTGQSPPLELMSAAALGVLAEPQTPSGTLPVTQPRTTT